MEPLGERYAVEIDAIAEYDVEKFPQNTGVLLDELGTDRQWYLPGETAWSRVSVQIGTNRDESGPIFEVVDDSVRPRAQPRLQRRACLSR